MKQSHRVAGRATLAALAATIVAFCLAPSAATAAGTLVAEPEEVDFGAVVHGTSQTRTVTVSNAGPDPVTLSEIGLFEGEIAGAEDEWAFDIVAGSCFDATVLAEGEGCALEVEFAPFAAAHEGLVLVEGGAEDTSAAIGLSGTGVLPDVLRATPSPVDFGTVTAVIARDPRIRSRTGSTRVTVENTGEQPLDLGTPAATPPFAASWNSCYATLAPGASCDVMLHLDVTGGLPAGRHDGTLTIPADLAAPLAVPLTVNAVNPNWRPVEPPKPHHATDPAMTEALERAIAPLPRQLRGGPRRALRLAGFDVGRAGVLQLRVRARGAKRRWTRIGGVRETAFKGEAARLRFRLNRAGRRLLAGRKRVLVETRLRFSDLSTKAIYTARSRPGSRRSPGAPARRSPSNSAGGPSGETSARPAASTHRAGGR
ncbi:MAG: choice-of-anchor D domain-containing protein [Solirubrobacterales bacterium]|nr:choice-of-anchor D domain-containing protein [Solirubrobacterales bacterium]